MSAPQHTAIEVRPGLLLRIFEGRSTLESTRAAMRALDSAMDTSHRPTLFIDTACVSSYETGARELFTEWMKVHLDTVAATHMLLHPGILRMAAQLLDLALGDDPITTYTERDDFDAQLRAMAPGVDLDTLRAA